MISSSPGVLQDDVAFSQLWQRRAAVRAHNQGSRSVEDLRGSRTDAPAAVAAQTQLQGACSCLRAQSKHSFRGSFASCLLRANTASRQLRGLCQS